eukprot:632772-Prymnesium_polylepis.1
MPAACSPATCVAAAAAAAAPGAYAAACAASVAWEDGASYARECAPPPALAPAADEAPALVLGTLGQVLAGAQ